MCLFCFILKLFICYIKKVKGVADVDENIVMKILQKCHIGSDIIIFVDK